MYNDYMANEWSQELHGDEKLFEKLTLESAQSGLSWRTILHKREAYRRTFYGFDIDKVAAMTTDDIQEILNQESPDNPHQVVVRNKGKITATVNNAQKVQKMIKEEGKGAFDSFLWSFVDFKPILNVSWKKLDPPKPSTEAQNMSKALKKLGFRFVGPTTCYSLMQSAGMVLDHPVDSPEWHAAKKRLQNRGND